MLTALATPGTSWGRGPGGSGGPGWAWVDQLIDRCATARFEEAHTCLREADAAAKAGRLTRANIDGGERFPAKLLLGPRTDRRAVDDERVEPPDAPDSIVRVSRERHDGEPLVRAAPLPADPRVRPQRDDRAGLACGDISVSQARPVRNVADRLEVADDRVHAGRR